MAKTGLPGGSPLALAVIGVADLDRSRAFYRDIIGMAEVAAADWRGPAFERLWHLPAGARARAVLLQAATHEVGRVLLLAFDASYRKVVRANKEKRAYSLFNLNFYTRDIFGAARELGQRGYEFWSEPTEHHFSPAVGSPVEVIFEGPDALPINLVELRGGAPESEIGRMRAFFDSHGTTATGFTPVVTTSHCVRSRDRGIAFYRDILGMHTIIDEEMNSPASNRFLTIAPDSRTHVTFMQGHHKFGKVAMSWPVNYTPPDLVPRAVAPNIGYLAQGFLVPDAAATLSAAVSDGAEAYTSAITAGIPGLGSRTVAVVRNPASGALTLLIDAG